MGYNYEVMQRSLDLAETVREGIEHIRSKFAEGRFEEMLPLLQDVTRAFISIQEALSKGEAAADLNFSVDQADRIRDGLTQLVRAYEEKDWDLAVKALENEAAPGFMLWKDELERRYRHRVSS